MRSLPEAIAEFVAAAPWYDRQRTGLGREFVEAGSTLLMQIQANPDAREIVYRSVRKAAQRRFPYVVLYSFDATEILIVSVFHTARDPLAWRSRVE